MWQLGKANEYIDDIKIYGDSLIKAMYKENVGGYVEDIDGDKPKLKEAV